MEGNKPMGAENAKYMNCCDSLNICPGEWDGY